MPIDFQDLRRQVQQWGKKAPVLEKERQNRCEDGQDWLEKFACEFDLLNRRVEAAAEADPWLRCAVPDQEALNAHHPLPAASTPAAVLAADGSQIFPNPHAQLPYGLINVGGFEIHPNSSIPPRETVKSALLTEEQVHTESGWIPEERIAMMRDLEERKFLAELASQTTGPIVTLTDGPLELFRESVARETPESRRLFREYLEALKDLARAGVTTAGYVDKPRSDLVVRLLEIAALPESELRQASKIHPLYGVTDAAIFGGLLEPGERSAVFGIRSHSASAFQDEADELRLYFFYLNVGRAGHPWITRTEIPAWVAGHQARLDQLHAILVEQCRALGARPYPYALHRAHEIAVVSLDEHAQVDAMLAQELYRRGAPVGEKSYKQSHKDHIGRTRMQR